jgi:hypothetical protein
VNDAIRHHLFASALHLCIRHHAAAMMDFSAPLTIPAAPCTAATRADSCNSTCSSITHVNTVILHHLYASALHLLTGHCVRAMLNSAWPLEANPLLLHSRRPNRRVKLHLQLRHTAE